MRATDDASWEDFLRKTGLETCRRGFAEELLLMDRGTAVGVGLELCAAGADFDGGEPEEGPS